jgi:hypothetical protein
MDFTFAQDIETASAGNGGAANAGANGGAVSAGDINSGGNAGSAISVGDTGMVCDKWGKCYGDGGSVAVDGGSIANSTSLGVAANGGSAIADASGGNYNVAFVS